jgi:PAS domain S-box-containing protein
MFLTHPSVGAQATDMRRVLIFCEGGLSSPAASFIDPIKIAINSTPYLLLLVLQTFLIIGLLIQRSKRRKIENVLRESEQRFRNLADGAPVMMWISGTDKKCTDFNRGWLEFTGRSLEQELGDGWADGVHPDDLQECLAIYNEAFDNRRPFTMGYRLRRHDGEYRWINDTGTPRFLADGTFAGYIGSCIDINDQKVAELARRELAGRLLNAQEVERARIGRELHDSVGQSIALLLMKMPDSVERDPERFEVRQQQLHQLKDKLKQLGLEVSRLSHQLHSSELEYLGLAGAIKGLCAEFSERYPVEVEYSATDLPRKLDGACALALFRLTQEAFHNIAKHSLAHSANVSLSIDGREHLVLSIQDDGVGFSVSGPSGHGLGLISMRERIHLVGGDFLVRSSPGNGSFIKASVPLRTAQPSKNSPVQTRNFQATL